MAGWQGAGQTRDREDALQMLRTMSGRTHEVFTGVCITTTDWQRSFTAQTEVRFATLSEEEIAYYVDNFQPMDKSWRLWSAGVDRFYRSGKYFRVVTIISWGFLCRNCTGNY